MDVIFGYTGKFLDRFTGLQNNWNRWYSPKLGRFVSQDPIGFAGGDANLYRYAGNEPTNYIDPTGWVGDEIPADLREEMRVYLQSPVQSACGRVNCASPYPPGYFGPQPASPEELATLSVMGQLGVAALGIVLEPVDWVITAHEIYNDPTNPLSYAGLLPLIPAGAGRALKQVPGADKIAQTLQTPPPIPIPLTDSRKLNNVAAPVKAADLPWARAGAARAAKAIEAGQTSIKVASRDDAAELVWRMFSSRGFLNTTGRTGSDVRKIVGSKAGTYHWDDVLDAAGNVTGHGANNAHAGMRHVQIHLENGDIVRIFFP